MARVKVKCSVCGNELDSFCKIKKTRINKNKSRKCEAYIYDESKLKAKESLNTVRVSYKEQQENKRRFKEEMREVRRMLKEQPHNQTARDLGLVKPDQGTIITPGDPRFVMPNGNPSHPLTGDLSRFTTTAKEKE